MLLILVVRSLRQEDYKSFVNLNVAWATYRDLASKGEEENKTHTHVCAFCPALD